MPLNKKLIKTLEAQVEEMKAQIGEEREIRRQYIAMLPGVRLQLDKVRQNAPRKPDLVKRDFLSGRPSAKGFTPEERAELLQAHREAERRHERKIQKIRGTYRAFHNHVTGCDAKIRYLTNEIEKKEQQIKLLKTGQSLDVRKKEDTGKKVRFDEASTTQPAKKPRLK